MKHFSVLLISFAAIYQTGFCDEKAVLGEALKQEYKVSGSFYKSFSQTGKYVDSYDMTCDVGHAIPNQKKENWYTNQSISGLILELRSVAAIINSGNKVKSMGFVVVTKHDDILITFTPLGDFVNGIWDGDTFNSWSTTDTDIEVFSERFGRTGYAHFDLLDGNGFFYKSDDRDEPDYFLSNCMRKKKSNVPVYEWK